MKQLDKSLQRRSDKDTSGANSTNDQRRRPKLQPVGKEKYKPKQVYLEDEDDVEIDLFGYLDDDDEEDGDEEE